MSPDQPPPASDNLPKFLEAFDDAVSSGDDTRVFFGEAADKFGRPVSELLRTIQILRNASPNKVFLEGLDDGATQLAEFADTESQDGQFGRFHILKELGVGGNGVVFLAFDPTLRRNVALKLPRLHAVFNPETERRFVNEAQAAAALHHPNIVPVFEVGHVGAVRYIVSAYCPGSNLAQWLRGTDADRRHVSTRTAVDWVAKLARAAEYAHGQGIVHRDIKPGNILLEIAANSNEAAARVDVQKAFVPRLTDFGIAKWMDEDAEATKTGNILGTFAYMSPEQAQGFKDLIGPTTDVYSLGIVLYELLTGRLPFVGSSTLQTLELIKDERPIPPSHFVKTLSRDMDAICLKCLEKRPSDRYTTAGQLAEDLERYLQNRPITARPVGGLDRAVKWTRRHPTRAFAGFAILIGLVFNAGAGWWYSRTLLTALNDTNAAKKQADALNHGFLQRVYPVDIRRAQRALQLGDRALARSLLAPYRTQSGDTDLRSFAWYHLWSLCHNELRTLEPDHGEANYVGFTPSGDFVITAGEDGTIRFWSAVDATLQKTMEGHTSCVNSLDLTADGRRMVTGSCDRTIRIWDVASASTIAQLDNAGTKVASVAFTPNEGHIVSGDFEGSYIRLWDVKTGESVATFPLPGDHKNSGTVGFLDNFQGREGRYLLSSAPDGLRAHDLEDELAIQDRHVAQQQPHLKAIRTAALSPDKSQVAFAASPLNARTGAGLDVQLLKLETSVDSDTLATLTGDTTPVFALKYSPDGRLLAAGTDSGIVCLWDVENAVIVARFVGHTARVTSLEFSTDGSQLLSASADGAIKYWPVTSQPSVVCLLVSAEVAEPTPRLCFNANSSRLTLVGGGGVQTWNTSDWSVDSQSPVPAWAHPNALACSSDRYDSENWTVAISHPDGLSVWDILHPARRRFVKTAPGSLALSRDGQWLAVSEYENVVVRSVENLDVAHTVKHLTSMNPPPPVALSPDGSKLAATDGARTRVLYWDFDRSPEAREEAKPTILSGHVLAVERLAFAGDGRHVCSASLDGTARVWDVESGRERTAFVNHSGAVRSIACAPQGSLVASGSENGAVRVWDSATGLEVLEFREKQVPAVELAFSPDGTMLACLYLAVDGQGHVVVWRAPRS